MELDELKTIWKKQGRNEEMEYSQSEILMIINNKMISFEEKVRSRDRLEFITAAVVVVIFSAWFFMASSLWTQIGCAILVGSSLFIGIRLKTNQPGKETEEPRFDHSLMEHLYTELGKVKSQHQLLRSVLWWYILPIYTGLVFITIGFEFPLIFKGGYLLVVTLMSAGIWYLNQKAVDERIEPLMREIQDSIRFLEKN